MVLRRGRGVKAFELPFWCGGIEGRLSGVAMAFAYYMPTNKKRASA